MKTEEMKTLLNEKVNMRQYLFPRGFLVTDDPSVDAKCYPFYGGWQVSQLRGYRFFVHPMQKLHIAENAEAAIALVGNAYFPFVEEAEYEEDRILQKALTLYCQDKAAFTEFFNLWTGLYALLIIEKGSLKLYGDAAGMYTVFYGTHKDHIYCASHTNLLGDVCGLQMDPYVERLVGYRFYHLFGISLPGDLSPYSQFKRLIPNHYAHYTGQWKPVRFFPTEENGLLDLSFEEIVDRSAQILSESMHLIHKKWDRAAISLTGGCDSKTTLACTNGVYDRYTYYSYTSSDSELVDAEAAGKICQMLGLSHKIYEISQNDEDYPEVETFRSLMEYNTGSIGKHNRNDVRKRAFFMEPEFDVEVKSWVSEVGRAYYHKRFDKKSFPKKLTPRYATSLYKVFATDRKLVRDTDQVFAEFLSQYYSDGSFDRIPWYDLFFWEFRMSSWNGIVITGEQQITCDITIPYNNRILLQLLLSTPVESRVKDEPHWAIMRKMNPKIADCGISVVNVKHTDRRAKMERLYLAVSSKLPF